MGSRTTPKPCPDVIRKIMDQLNQDFASKHPDKANHYSINSCLVNRYEGNNSTLPEHLPVAKINLILAMNPLGSSSWYQNKAETV